VWADVWHVRAGLMGSASATSDGRLDLASDLNFQARRAFIAASQSAIQLADGSVSVNCSAIDVIGPVDDAVIGMLVTLVRTAQQRGRTVELIRAPRLMRAQFEAAGVAGLFDWRG